MFLHANRGLLNRHCAREKGIVQPTGNQTEKRQKRLSYCPKKRLGKTKSENDYDATLHESRRGGGPKKKKEEGIGTRENRGRRGWLGNCCLQTAGRVAARETRSGILVQWKVFNRFATNGVPDTKLFPQSRIMGSREGKFPDSLVCGRKSAPARWEEIDPAFT